MKDRAEMKLKIDALESENEDLRTNLTNDIGKLQDLYFAHEKFFFAKLLRYP